LDSWFISLKLRKLLASLDWSEVGLHFVVHNQHKGSTHTSEDVGESTLEESLTTFVLDDLSDTIHSTSVHDILSTRLHHESSSDGIKRVRDQTRDTSDKLGNEELVENAALAIVEENSLKSIVTTEVAGSVDDDTEDRDTETLIESLDTISSSDLVDAVNETVELSVRSTLTDIGSKSGSGEIQRINDHQRGSTSSTTRCQVTEEEFPEISSGVVGAEDLLVCVLESEVKGLSGEISDDVSEISSPESADTFFLGDSHHAVNNTLVLHVASDLSVSILGLEEELDSFNGGNSSLGDSSRDTTQQEVKCEVTSFHFRTFTHFY